MGRIIHSKEIPNQKIFCKLILSQDEIKNLKGHMKKIHLFSSDLCDKESYINNRGNKGVTKYFKVPLNIRPRKKQTGSQDCQKLDTPTKTFYIYTIEK